MGSHLTFLLVLLVNKSKVGILSKRNKATYLWYNSGKLNEKVLQKESKKIKIGFKPI